MAWNPHKFPSPAELGYTKGARVVSTHDGIAYLGTVMRVLKEAIVVKDDRSGVMMKAHPCVGVMLLVDAKQDYPDRVVRDLTAEMHRRVQVMHVTSYGESSREVSKKTA
jgi:hypothetical protein